MTSCCRARNCSPRSISTAPRSRTPPRRCRCRYPNRPRKRTRARPMTRPPWRRTARMPRPRRTARAPRNRRPGTRSMAGCSAWPA
ncbi:hypothetical protein AL504_31545 [Achromobacter xylosoxidans]|uniref:Uncharacterized protein n=1 Tax=Alcaligenes xylosoxydans xylosoxydans TaxID=85698 RepID=A0A2L0PTR8_ALCXX|nr:hypothetical protein AL504_31545 [Achromobacter xylosoxidans]